MHVLTTFSQQLAILCHAVQNLLANQWCPLPTSPKHVCQLTGYTGKLASLLLSHIGSSTYVQLLHLSIKQPMHSFAAQLVTVSGIYAQNVLLVSKHNMYSLDLLATSRHANRLPYLICLLLSFQNSFTHGSDAKHTAPCSYYLTIIISSSASMEHLRMRSLL